MCACCGVIQFLIQQGKLFQCQKCGLVTNPPKDAKCPGCGADANTESDGSDCCGSGCCSDDGCSCGPDCGCHK